MVIMMMTTMMMMVTLKLMMRMAVTRNESIPLTRRGSVSSMVRVTEMSELLLSSPTKDFHSFAEFLKHRSFWNLRDPSWGCLSPFHLLLISILALFCGL